jgi:transcriptional regulator with XRE-family HTH domain
MTTVRPRFKKGSHRHYVREWRLHRGLSLTRLAERIGVTHGAISQLENGKVAYTQGMLEALADALNCTPADLVGRPPGIEFGIRADFARVFAALQRATPEERQRIEQIVEVMVPSRTGTEG